MNSTKLAEQIMTDMEWPKEVERLNEQLVNATAREVALMADVERLKMAIFRDMAEHSNLRVAADDALNRDHNRLQSTWMDKLEEALEADSEVVLATIQATEWDKCADVCDSMLGEEINFNGVMFPHELTKKLRQKAKELRNG